MTTIDGRDTLPPTSAVEVYLSPDELQIGALYEVESDYLEAIAYCIDREYFYGLHVEARNGVFSLRIGKERHRSLREKAGLGFGLLPKCEFLSTQHVVLSNNDEKLQDLASLLTQQNYRYYLSLQVNPHLTSMLPEIVDFKCDLFSKIIVGLQNGTLQPSDEHGHIDLTPLEVDY